MAAIKVTKYPRASVLEDGSIIEMELHGTDKERVILRFDPDDIDRFLARVLQVIADARNQKHAKSGHPGLPVLATVGAGAGPAEGGSHVVVYLKTTTGTEFHFAIPTDGAAQLGEHVAAAVAEARKQAAQTRQ